MGCLSGHVHYATRILGFWMLTRAVTRSVAVGCFVVIVGWLLAAEARGGKGEGPVTFFRRCRPPGREGTTHLLLCCVCCVLLLLVVVGRGVPCGGDVVVQAFRRLSIFQNAHSRSSHVLTQ